MTKPHPLTDEIIRKIAPFDSDGTRDQLARFIKRNNDMRTAYDMGESEGRADMLDEMIEWISKNLLLYERNGLPRYLKNTTHSECAVIDEWKVISDLKKAMRPQEES